MCVGFSESLSIVFTIDVSRIWVGLEAIIFKGVAEEATGTTGWFLRGPDRITVDKAKA